MLHLVVDNVSFGEAGFSAELLQLLDQVSFKTLPAGQIVCKFARTDLPPDIKDLELRTELEKLMATLDENACAALNRKPKRDSEALENNQNKENI